MMNNFILPYLAGVVDSEGCMTIQKTNNHTGSYTYSERLSAEMKDIEAIELLSDVFDHAYYTYYHSTDGNPFYCFVTLSKRANYVIRALYPYLRVKRKQADILLQLREFKDKFPYPKGGSNCKRSLEELEKQERLYLAIKELNHAKSH